MSDELSEEQQREIRWLGDLQRLHLEPGDQLVLMVPELLSDEAYARIKKNLEENMPGVRCIILEEGIKLGALNTEAT